MNEDEGPRTVKDLLREIKDSSELMVDLAYAAVFFNDADLAGTEKVGVTAGASTPNWLIEKIVKHLEEIGREQSAGLKP